MTRNITIFIAVLCAVVAVAGFASARGARKALEHAIESNNTYSNQMVTIQATLAERDATIQTLRIQGELAEKDHRTAGQSYTNLLVKLTESGNAITTAQKELQTKQNEIAVRSSELASERDENSRARQRIVALEAELAARRSELSTLHVEMETLQQRANQTATKYSELLNKWADPSSLEAQFRKSRQGSRGTASSGKGQLMLRSDGSVVVAQ